MYLSHKRAKDVLDKTISFFPLPPSQDEIEARKNELNTLTAPVNRVLVSSLEVLGMLFLVVSMACGVLGVGKFVKSAQDIDALNLMGTAALFLLSAYYTNTLVMLYKQVLESAAEKYQLLLPLPADDFAKMLELCQGTQEGGAYWRKILSQKREFVKAELLILADCVKLELRNACYRKLYGATH